MCCTRSLSSGSGSLASAFDNSEAVVLSKVTYKLLSRLSNIHVNRAKQCALSLLCVLISSCLNTNTNRCLYAFHQANLAKTHATYILTGILLPEAKPEPIEEVANGVATNGAAEEDTDMKVDTKVQFDEGVGEPQDSQTSDIVDAIPEETVSVHGILLAQQEDLDSA